MDNETRAAFEKLTKLVQTGFAVMEEGVEKGFGAIEERMEAGFAAVADDISDIRHDMATKGHVAELHTQVNAIEKQLRGMKYVKLESRVADLEEEAFGESRA